MRKCLPPPFKLNFVDNQYIDKYRSLFATAGQIGMDNGLDIMRTDYKSDYCVFGCDKSPFLCHGEAQGWKRNGTLRANTEFRAPLPNSINVIMYMEFNNSIFVDKTSKADHERLLKMYGSHLCCIFYKDPFTGEIIEGVFAKD